MIDWEMKDIDRLGNEGDDRLRNEGDDKLGNEGDDKKWRSW